jgi:pyrroline-5-carboxylate reductase
LKQLTDDCDILILATKPQQAEHALHSVSLRGDQCLISLAAGISIKFLNQVLNDTTANPVKHIIRAMPNTPSLIGSGICGLYTAAETQNIFGDVAEAIFSAVGAFVWINEEAHMDVVTAISGSGPAYYFLFVEAVISAAIKLGLDKDTATKLAIETLSGSAALLKSSTTDPTLLRQRVTSPGGTTAAAIASFEKNNFQNIIIDAISAATERGKTLNQDCLARLKIEK